MFFQNLCFLLIQLLILLMLQEWSGELKQCYLKQPPTISYIIYLISKLYVSGAFPLVTWGRRFASVSTGPGPKWISAKNIKPQLQSFQELTEPSEAPKGDLVKNQRAIPGQDQDSARTHKRLRITYSLLTVCSLLYFLPPSNTWIVLQPRQNVC